MNRLIDHIIKWRTLPVNSQQEVDLRKAIAQRVTQLEMAEREAVVLKRIGTAFKLHQTVAPSIIHATHSIRGALNLLGVRVWLNKKGTLTAISTAQERNRHVQLPLSESPENPANIATWEIWDTCLRALLPLQVADQKLGYLELFDSVENHSFLHERDLHHTIAEQLSLVVESALLFENTEALATTDPLTGLCNHRTLYEFLNDQCDDVRKQHHKVGVVMVDVDHFRQFNETYGHDAGDEVLIKVGKALQDSVGNLGMAARYGGEEFTLIIPKADDDLTRRMAKAALEEIRNIVFIDPQGNKKSITASFGYSCGPSNGNQPEQLLKIADQALYTSKHNGRNRVSGPYDINPGERRRAS